MSLSVSVMENHDGMMISNMMFSNYRSTVSEIEEEESSSELFEIGGCGGGGHGSRPISREEIEGSLFSFDVQNGEEAEVDGVYVAVGKSESSMEALAWALKHAVSPSTVVYLIHVFPEIRHIPTPLGKLPKRQVSPEQVENYMAQERGKRRELLQKFLDSCSASKVKVDTMLIESDMVAKAVVDLIPILNIRKLVVGTTKSSLRKSRARRGNGIVDQILQHAPETCEIKIICEGKDVIDQMIGSPSQHVNDDVPNPTQEQVQSKESFSWMCFKCPIGANASTRRDVS